MYQGDAAANEKHRGGKTTKTQVPAVDSFAIPTSLAISKNFKYFFSVPQSLFFVKFVSENIDQYFHCRGKCGILGFVANFMEFAETTEKIFRDSDRKGDLEKW